MYLYAQCDCGTSLKIIVFDAAADGLDAAEVCKPILVNPPVVFPAEEPPPDVPPPPVLILVFAFTVTGGNVTENSAVLYFTDAVSTTSVSLNGLTTEPLFLITDVSLDDQIIEAP